MDFFRFFVLLIVFVVVKHYLAATSFSRSRSDCWLILDLSPMGQMSSFCKFSVVFGTSFGRSSGEKLFRFGCCFFRKV